MDAKFISLISDPRVNADEPELHEVLCYILKMQDHSVNFTESADECDRNGTTKGCRLAMRRFIRYSDREVKKSVTAAKRLCQAQISNAK